MIVSLEHARYDALSGAERRFIQAVQAARPLGRDGKVEALADALSFLLRATDSMSVKTKLQGVAIERARRTLQRVCR